MLIILITPPDDRPSERGWIEALLAAGVHRLHVRKPSYTPRELEAYLRPLVAAGLGSRMAVHRHHEVALACGAAQVHLPRGEREMATALQGRIRLSTSAHSLEEIYSLAPIWDYAFLSPIFPSISKRGYAQDFDECALRTLPARSPCPVVALGGVNATRAELVAAWGWHGLAILGTIWQRRSLREALVELSKLQMYAENS